MVITNDSKKILSFIQSHDSLISKKAAVCKNRSGGIPVIKGKGGNVIDDRFLNVITDRPSPDWHIDIMLEDDIRLLYDITDKPFPIDRFVLIGFDGGEYAVRSFKIYAGDSSDIFDDAHILCDYKCTVEYEPNKRKTCDVMIELTKAVKAKYFGIKISEPNPTDDCMRLSYLGLYSVLYDRTFSAIASFGNNLLTSDDISLNSEKAEILVDGFAYNDSFVTGVNSITALCADKVNKGIFRAFFDGEDAKLRINGENPVYKYTPFGDKYAEYALENGEDSVVLDVGSGIKLYELGLYETELYIEVTDRVKVSDFYGIGACVLPMAFMDRSLAEGFNEVYWEKEKSRVNLCKPAVVRLWFQPDWFIIDKETYYRHEYDFDSEKMKAVYPYLDLFKEFGIDVEMNFGWKVDDRITSWYSIPGVPRPRESAPADLDEFAYSCAEFMTEMIVRRGYDNIKYLTFYNEPGSRYVYSEAWTGDFHVGPSIHEKVKIGEMATEKYDYWHKMIEKVKEALVGCGMYERIKLWGPELATTNVLNALPWIGGFENDDPKLLNAFTVHKYRYNDAEIAEMMQLFRKKSNLPICVTEFAAPQNGETWEVSDGQMALSYIRNGYSAALLWLLSGTSLASPLNFSIDGADENLWSAVHKNTCCIHPSFYKLSLLMRYIPAHSKTVYVKEPASQTNSYFDSDSINWKKIEDTDVRAAALITPSGDYVIVVQTRKRKEKRTVKIKLPTNKRLVFNKFVADTDRESTKPARLPYASKQIETENGYLTDVAETGGAFTVYTTQKPYEQVISDDDIICLKPGESRKINYKLYDCKGNVSFEIACGNKSISVNEDMVTAHDTAQKGDMAAIKLMLDNSYGSYDVALVKIV